MSSGVVKKDNPLEGVLPSITMTGYVVDYEAQCIFHMIKKKLIFYINSWILRNSMISFNIAGCNSSLYPFWGISPKGARHNSPGHRPGRKNEFRSSPERAVQARRTHISPFQGWLPARFKPRAMPWAKVFLPFRQIQLSSQRGYKLESHPTQRRRDAES